MSNFFTKVKEVRKPLAAIEKETFRAAKRVGQQTKRSGQDIADVFDFLKPPESLEPPPLPAIPEIEEPGDATRRGARRRRGFRRTIITGALTPQTGKKVSLG